MRPTIRDVARASGVSPATVDRVLNRRAGVRAETVARVEAAVSELGFVRDGAAARLARKRFDRFLFVLPEGRNAFMRGLEARVREAARHAAHERTEIVVITAPAFDGAALAHTLDGIDPASVSGVAVVATDAPEVRRALERLHTAGLPVVTIVSDTPAFRRRHYIGIDNVAAGRTAASLIGRLSAGRQGRIAFLAGSMLVRDHVERRMGFDQVLRQEYPRLECLPVLETRDESAAARDLLAACLADTPDVVGVYNSGAGNRGVIEALAARPEFRDLVVVAHELTPHSRAALHSGLFDAIINQDAEHEVQSALRQLRACVDGAPMGAAHDPVRIEIYLRDNLP